VSAVQAGAWVFALVSVAAAGVAAVSAFKSRWAAEDAQRAEKAVNRESRRGRDRGDR
jgi:hypothetical protein